MNHYYTRLSFEKLENFDMQRQKLSSFVLVRNSLITALTLQQQQHNDMVMMDYDHEPYDPTVPTTNTNEHRGDSMLFDGKDEEEQQVWLDSCFNELDQQGQGQNQDDFDEYDDDFYGSSEEDEMPSSPQDDDIVPFYHKSNRSHKKRPTFFINEDEEDEEDGLICYDIPFLSLVDQRPPPSVTNPMSF